MTAVLLWVKHHCPTFWRLIEKLNVLLLRLFWAERIEEVKRRFARKELPAGYAGLLSAADIDPLLDLLSGVSEEEKRVFQPHEFDRRSLRSVLTDSRFLPFGFFVGDELVGYFFLRLFTVRKSFMGRYVKKEARDRGVGKDMAGMLYDVAGALGFELYSTISAQNAASLRSHQYHGRMTVVRRLPNDYVLIKIGEPLPSASAAPKEADAFRT